MNGNHELTMGAGVSVSVAADVVSIVNMTAVSSVVRGRRHVSVSVMARMAMRVMGQRGRQQHAAQRGESEYRGAGAKSPVLIHENLQ